MFKLGAPALVLVVALSLATSEPSYAHSMRLTKPSAPQSVTASPGELGAVLSWSAPTSDGGSPITGYTAIVTRGGQSCTTSGETTCTITGLGNGIRYLIKVRASNSVGAGKPANVRVTPSDVNNCSFFGPSANLQGCDLTGANLSSINLSGAVLTAANLTDANLTDTNLTNGHLMDTDITNADFIGATLTAVTTSGVIGAPESLPIDWALVEGYLIGPQAVLNESTLVGANLVGDDMSGVSMIDSNLSNSNLTGVDLTNSIVSGTNFTNVNLTNANLTGAYAAGTIVTGIIWSNTTCPDGTNSDNDGDTCVNNG